MAINECVCVDACIWIGARICHFAAVICFVIFFRVACQNVMIVLTTFYINVNVLNFYFSYMHTCLYFPVASTSVNIHVLSRGFLDLKLTKLICNGLSRGFEIYEINILILNACLIHH